MCLEFHALDCAGVSAGVLYLFKVVDYIEGIMDSGDHIAGAAGAADFIDFNASANQIQSIIL